MVQSAIERVLEARQPAPVVAVPEPAPEGDKFYSILVGEASQEHYLEFRFQKGLKTAFAYSDLAWFNYDPESGTLDLVFGGFWVKVKGRGLGDRIFDGIKQKRVAWIKEKDSEMQDHKDNAVFVEEITISPPEFGNEEDSEA